MLAQTLAAAPANELPAPRISSLRRWNVGMGFCTRSRGSRCWASRRRSRCRSRPASWPVLRHPGRLADDPVRNLGRLGVALFLFLSAAFHWLVAAPRSRLPHRRPRGQPQLLPVGVEYSLSSSMMIVLIAMLTDRDVAALIGLRGERRDDLLRCRAGAVRAAVRLPVVVLARLRRGHRLVAGDRHLLGRPAAPPSRRRSSTRSSCRCSSSSTSSPSTCCFSTGGSAAGATTSSAKPPTSS